jgi:hypothetical protein
VSCFKLFDEALYVGRNSFFRGRRLLRRLFGVLDGWLYVFAVVLIAVFMGASPLGFCRCRLGRARVVLRVVPIEYRGDMGCGEVFELILEKFHGDMT